MTTAYAGATAVHSMRVGSSLVTFPSTALPAHTIWGSASPTGTFTMQTDGSDIELGCAFYRFGTADALYPTRIVGGRLFKASGVTMPSGNVDLKIYTNPGVVGGSSFGTLVGSVTRANSAMANGWNEFTLTTPVAMPGPGGLVVVTYRFPSEPGKYMHNGSARPGAAEVQASDGTRLYWSETGAGYNGTYYRIGGGGISSGGVTASYGTDLIVDMG